MTKDFTFTIILNNGDIDKGRMLKFTNYFSLLPTLVMPVLAVIYNCHFCFHSIPD